MGGKFGGKGGGKFGKGGGGAADRCQRPDGADFGSDLLVRDLATKTERTFADVTQFTLSKDGQLLVYTVASRKEETNGVYAVNPRSGGSAAAIKVGPGRYSGLTWDEKQTKLAFLYDDSAVEPANHAPPPRPDGRRRSVPPFATSAPRCHRNGARSSGIATPRPSSSPITRARRCDRRLRVAHSGRPGREPRPTFAGGRSSRADHARPATRAGPSTAAR